MIEVTPELRQLISKSIDRGFWIGTGMWPDEVRSRGYERHRDQQIDNLLMDAGCVLETKRDD